MMKLNKLFNNSNISIISTKTEAEYDKLFQSYLSYMFDENTVIFTDNFSLLDNVRKYNQVYTKYHEWSDIIYIIKSLKNVKIFVDIYIDNITGMYINNQIFETIISICYDNNLQIVFVSQYYSRLNNRLIVVSDLWFEYHSNHKELILRKSRYFSSNMILNLRYWKYHLRQSKIKRLLKK